jgi:hypothetical protein
MTQAEFMVQYRAMETKVLALEAGMKRLLEYIERERQAAIMLVGQADDALGKDRTIPKHRDRRSTQ